MTSKANFFPPGLALRTIRPTDNEAVRALFMASQERFKAPDLELDIRIAAKKYFDHVFTSDLSKPSAHYSQPRRRLWALESRTHEIAAMIAVDSYPEEPDVAELKRLAVAKEYRRKGVARLLVREAEQWAEKQGFNKIKLETTEFQPEAIALYETSGYAHSGSYEYGPIHVVLMEKALSS